MVRIHREPPVEGPPGGAVPYKHFGARLARLGRFDSCTLYQKMFRAGSSTDQNSWPTPNRCGFNSRTAHQAGLARRSSPRSIIARCWFDSNILHHFVFGRVAERIRHLTTNQVHVGSIPTAPSKEFVGDWQRWLMHSPLKRDQARSIPAVTHQNLRDWQMRLCTRL